jgi:hypothetical protein
MGQRATGPLAERRAVPGPLPWHVGPSGTTQFAIRTWWAVPNTVRTGPFGHL